jgi:hypothetical protein
LTSYLSPLARKCEVLGIKELSESNPALLRTLALNIEESIVLEGDTTASGDDHLIGLALQLVFYHQTGPPVSFGNAT